MVIYVGFLYVLTRPSWKPAKRCLGKRVSLVIPTYLPQITMIIITITKLSIWLAINCPDSITYCRWNYEYMKIIYVKCGAGKIIWRKIIAVIYATYAVAKRKPEKIQACTGFGPLTCCDTGAALSVRVIILPRVYNETIQRPAPSWLFNLTGRALHRYRKGQEFESHTSLNFFQVFFSQLHKLRI